MNQPAVAELERRADMYVSNLRAYIEALGGKLNIVAEFPQGAVTITNFSDADEDALIPCAARNKTRTSGSHACREVAPIVVGAGSPGMAQSLRECGI